MSRHSLFPIFSLALWPLGAEAQDGPSFDCRDASTATEIAICDSPALSRLEMRMFEAYQDLVGRIGEPRARDLADRHLERRQACGANEDCIARRLFVSMRVFERRGLPGTRMTEADPRGFDPDPPLPVEPPLVGEEDRLPEDETDLAAAEPPPALDLDEAFAGAELTSSEEAAAPGMALPRAFLSLSSEERALIQSRLSEAGFHDGTVGGDWDEPTSAALDAFLTSEVGQGFDLSTESGAALALDYIGSDAFALAYGLPTEETEVVEAEPDLIDPIAPEIVEAEPDLSDPLAGTEW